MRVSGWGRYPTIDAHQIAFGALHQENMFEGSESRFIPRGLGRSYGDSALCDDILVMSAWNNFIHFDEVSGVLRCQSGVSLADILTTFVPQGWFLPVTPGTKFVTIGGAIASDVHGKNHHVDGCFSEFVHEIVLLDAQGNRQYCSKSEKQSLFNATCGGMGLTGVVVEATLQLMRIESSYLVESTYKSSSLKETFELFDQSIGASYSVAWIDCLVKGASMGRSLLMTAEHAADGDFQIHSQSSLVVPVNAPSFMLNHYSIKAFNQLYYSRVRAKKKTKVVRYDPYFYPLDNIQNWNRLYGKKGFLQYQFVIPKENGLQVMTTILKEIVDSGRGSFLAVLKLFGKKNKSYLSFPMEGYTLALDFKYDNSLLPFLERLDGMVMECGGRVYLTKDARLSEQAFKSMYPEWEDFQQVRENYGATRRFASLQSERLGL